MTARRSKATTPPPATLPVRRIAGRCRFCDSAFERDNAPDLSADLCSIPCRDRESRGALLPHEHRLAEFHAGQRLAPDALVAAELGLTPAAWGKLRRSDHDLKEALARGRAREHQRLVLALYEEATQGGNVQAATFLLRCRHGYDDKAPESGARVNVQINLPRALSADEYARLRTVIAGPRASEPVNVTPRAIGPETNGGPA